MAQIDKDLTTWTAKELANYVFELTGKNLKPSSYPKAKFIGMIEEAKAKALLEDKAELAQQTDDGPIAAEGSEEADDSSLAEMLALDETEFTMSEVAAAAGVSPKVARARYRAVSNDNQRTFYRFPRSQWDAILTIISPKRKAR